jgi:hypothetical protein
MIIPVGREISLPPLPNGSHRLEVQAIDSSDQRTSCRTANFTAEEKRRPVELARITGQLDFGRFLR